MIQLVFTNPRHHLEAMLPVARALDGQGVPVRFVSLAELRGFETPRMSMDLVRAIPFHVRKAPSAGARIGTTTPWTRMFRGAVQDAMWRAALGPRLRKVLHVARGTVTVVPNDTAYPYDRLTRMLRSAGAPFALIQEGIRFPLPVEGAAETAYGTGGADALYVWGEASAEHFRSVGVPAQRIEITGTPRFDGLDVGAWREQGVALRERLGLREAPLLYLSNTIDDQGFCSTDEKMALFRAFLEGATPALREAGRGLVVKLHPREDPAAFRSIAARVENLAIHVVDEPLFAVLAMGRAAVVLASTVGLEALAFGLPLGVLAIPGHGHVFEYVRRGAARGLMAGDRDGVAALLREEAQPDVVPTFLARHMAHRGEAARRIAAHLVGLHRRALGPRRESRGAEWSA